MHPKETRTPGASPKKVYKTPRLKTLGSVKKLTLKVGSNVDGFGSFG
ncbi:hypothetical protein GGR92_002747 [Spirosoma lacussanchae]|nr:hypothetical protein [Spirosoma lacussanchae]